MNIDNNCKKDHCDCNHPCNNPDIIPITNNFMHPNGNQVYDIFLNKKNGIVYLKGSDKHSNTVVKLNKNIEVNCCNHHHHNHHNSSSESDNCTNESCTTNTSNTSDSHSNTSDSHSNTSDSNSHSNSHNSGCVINTNLFKFNGLYNSINDLNNVLNPLDTSISLVRTTIDHKMNVDIYIYSAKLVNNLNIGWNLMGSLFTTLCISNNPIIPVKECKEFTLINPKLIKNSVLFDSNKFKSGKGQLHLPNIYYFITFENVIGSNEINESINNYYRVPLDGNYIVEYNISWFFSNMANGKFKQNIKSISISESNSCVSESSNCSDDSVLEDANDDGVMIIIIKVLDGVIEIIYSSIKKQEGYCFPSNISHSFKHNFCENELILMMVYNLHTKSSIFFNIFYDDTYLKLKYLSA